MYTSLNSCRKRQIKDETAENIYFTNKKVFNVTLKSQYNEKKMHPKLEEKESILKTLTTLYHATFQ